MIWSGLFWLLLYLRPLSVIFAVSWLFGGVLCGLIEAFFVLMNVALSSSYIGSFSAIVQSTILFSCCKRFISRSFVPWAPKYPLVMFRDHYAQAWQWSAVHWLHIALFTNAILSASHFMSMALLSFYGVFWLASALIYSLQEPLALRFVPTLMSRSASSMTMFLSLAFCLEHWAHACCPSRGIRSFTLFIGGYWESMLLYYSFFHFIHHAS